MSIADFIDAVADGKSTVAKSVFETELKTRVVDAIDAKRAEVGQSMSSFEGEETPIKSQSGD